MLEILSILLSIVLQIQSFSYSLCTCVVSIWPGLHEYFKMSKDRIAVSGNLVSQLITVYLLKLDTSLFINNTANIHRRSMKHFTMYYLTFRWRMGLREQFPLGHI